MKPQEWGGSNPPRVVKCQIQKEEEEEEERASTNDNCNYAAYPIKYMTMEHSFSSNTPSHSFSTGNCNYAWFQNGFKDARISMSKSPDILEFRSIHIWTQSISATSIFIIRKVKYVFTRGISDSPYDDTVLTSTVRVIDTCSLLSAIKWPKISFNWFLIGHWWNRCVTVENCYWFRSAS